MRFSQETIQTAFDEIARLKIDNKFWGVCAILKNEKESSQLQTSMGNMNLIVSDKGGIQKDLREFFSLQSVTAEELSPTSTDDVWILLRTDFEDWVSQLLGNQRIGYLPLAVFLFRNRNFSEQPSKESLIKDVKDLLKFPDEWEGKWFEETSSIELQFEDSMSQSWANQFSVHERTYEFQSFHNSIVFKPSKEKSSDKYYYSVSARPDALGQGPFYQPLYSALGNALLFIDKRFFEKAQKQKNIATEIAETKSFHPTQLIYYGVPGCGKSHRIKERLKGVPEENVVRVVFHPEYSNADFVGQIFPHVIPGGGVDYRFKPGPFAEIVRRAYRKQEEEFFLIIEEINRGNAAAIFGEMFQLLDRIKPGDSAENLSGNTYTEGFSAYGVNNDDVNAYVRLKNPGDKDPEEKISFAAGEFSLNTAIRLPPNLSIFATMNTSDQNVFALDNAFQRRFQTEMIPNVLDKDSEEYRLQIADTGVCWGSFREWINDKILSAAGGFSRGEDKCLGSYFITGEAGKISQKNFAEKVLKYLWDDVFRRSSGQNVFNEKIRSLSMLIDEFEKANGFAAFENIFQLAEDDKSLLHKFAGESVGEISDESGEIVGENLGGENP